MYQTRDTFRTFLDTPLPRSLTYDWQMVTWQISHDQTCYIGCFSGWASAVTNSVRTFSNGTWMSFPSPHCPPHLSPPRWGRLQAAAVALVVLPWVNASGTSAFGFTCPVQSVIIRLERFVGLAISLLASEWIDIWYIAHCPLSLCAMRATSLNVLLLRKTKTNLFRHL